MLFYPSAPAAARDVVLRVRQASRPSAPRGSGRQRPEPGRAGRLGARTVPASSVPQRAASSSSASSSSASSSSASSRSVSSGSVSSGAVSSIDGRSIDGSSASGAAHQRARARRALRRQLARASARIENGSEYQRSLARLSELAAGFQRGLDTVQKSRWLTLEEAMLEHTARLNRAYFYAGAQAGARDARVRSSSHQRSPAVDGSAEKATAAGAASVGAESLSAASLGAAAADAVAADARLIAALAELAAQLLRRGG
jgi:perilipin-4